MSEPKLLTLTETIEEATTRQALKIIEGGVRACENAVAQIRAMAQDRGGGAAFLAELGDQADGIMAACTKYKNMIIALSDVVVDITLPEATPPEA